ncbi:hypothetical protein ACFWY6_14540 [Streptomyces sp. NPDC059037]|uniref:hypothetical protein n=1 Tax=Streptomyces sp. NPDC059037 TaxID=3346710 RepID=UPI0036855A32
MRVIQAFDEPALEGWFAVVLEDPHLLQDYDDVAGGQVQGPAAGRRSLCAEFVAFGVAGEDDGRALVDGEGDVASLAAGLG